MKLAALLSITMRLILLVVLPRPADSAPPQAGAPVQRFVCNTGYTVKSCQKDLAVLRRALAKYPVAQLGNWTWVLVRSEDWKAILVPRGLNPDSPAFTFYAKSETFIEEALVREVPGRHRELLLKWNMSMGDLLDFAIAHELGHALCNEKDEWKANLAAKMLQEGNSPSCEVSLEARTQAGKLRKPR